jgi:ribosomal protein L25 (general stress protein Ctc)
VASPLWGASDSGAEPVLKPALNSANAGLVQKEIHHGTLPASIRAARRRWQGCGAPAAHEGPASAVLYGRADKPVGLSLNEVEMKGILRKHPESAIVDLSIAGGTTINAIVRDVAAPSRQRETGAHRPPAHPSR